MLSNQLHACSMSFQMVYHDNIFIFDKVMCKLLRKCQFFHIFTYALIHKHAFTFLNVTQNCTTFKFHNTFFRKLDKICKNKVCSGHKVLGRLIGKNLGYICRYRNNSSQIATLLWPFFGCSFPKRKYLSLSHLLE